MRTRVGVGRSWIRWPAIMQFGSSFLIGLVFPWLVFVVFLLSPLLQGMLLSIPASSALPTPIGISPRLLLHELTLFGMVFPSLLNTLYTDRIVAHLLDVRLRMLVTLLILITFFLLLALLRISLPAFYTGIRISILFLLLLAFFLTTGFQTFFLVFHEVLFPMGNYAFPRESLIKQLYPDTFFFLLALIALIASILLSLFLLLSRGERHRFSLILPLQRSPSKRG